MTESTHAGMDIAALEAAAVAMLDPLVSPASNWRQTLPELIQQCAATATDLKLPGFAKLAMHLARCLQKGDMRGRDKELAGEWVASAIEFCSGHMLAEDAATLIDIPLRWKHVARLSSKTAMRKLLPRLVTEADLVMRLRLRDESQSGAPAAVTVGSDEMRMMSDACEDMAAALARNDAETESGLGEFAEGLQNAGNALEHIGLSALADLFRSMAGLIADQISGDSQAQTDQISAYRAWPTAWSQWFLHPVALTLDQALDWHRKALGSSERRRFDDHVGQRLRDYLSAIEVVPSRRIEILAGDGDDVDLSLTMATDVDREVVAQLLIELPELAAAFARSIDRIVRGEADGPGEARRVAHTIKGAANTAGVTGIANLTHRIEDLLQLIEDTADADAAPDADLVVVLSDAADCVADMVDALPVNEHGGDQAVSELRARMASIYRTVGEWVQDLMPTEESGAVVSPGQALPMPDITDFDLPDLELGVGSGATGSETASERQAQAAGPASVPAGATPWVAPDPDNDGSGALGSGSTSVSVGSARIDTLMEAGNEAMVLLAQLRETIASTNVLRTRWQQDAERLSQLASELDRQLDAAPSSASTQADTANDPLALERYSELHTVSRRLSEVAADGKLLDQQLAGELARMDELTNKLDANQAAARDAALAIRLVPAQSIELRLQRVARQAARLSDKSATLQLAGADTAVDADILQRLLEPLSHLIRNAVDHGLETAEVRTAAGKPASGTIVVSFAREGTHLHVVVRDDGAGLDIPSITSKAVALGLVPTGTTLDAAAAAQLVLAPGFSTRQQATQLSGRGIGLDVVSQALRSLRGELSITFEAGLGASFEISLPMQMSAVPVFVLRSATHVVAVSIRAVEKILPAADQDDTVDANRMMYENRMLEVRRLDQALGLPIGSLNPARADALPGTATRDEVVAIVHNRGGGLSALRLPDPGQTRQVVVRALPPALRQIAGIDGLAVLGDGAVAAVCDLPELIATSASAAPDPRQLPSSAYSNQPVCLLVDDSVTVRRATGQLLNDLGLNVLQANDGRDALQRMASTVPAIIVTDLEMPNLNGIDLAGEVRADERLRSVPIVMVTSRHSERHRDAALQAGVNHFVTKPYSEEEFAALINRLLA